jgi:hypothetical protein
MCEIILFASRHGGRRTILDKNELRQRLNRIVAEVVEAWGNHEADAVAALGVRIFDHLEIDDLIPGKRTVEVLQRVDCRWLASIDDTIQPSMMSVKPSDFG